MTAGILFVENYIPGGSDQVARTLLERLPFSRLTVMVNRGNDTRILLAGTLPEHVTVEYYDLVTIPEVIGFAKRCENVPLRLFLRAAERLVRLPLFAVSVAYFMHRIAKAEASVFVANNGGYPAGPYCRSATIAATLIPGMKVFHLVHSMAVPARGKFAPFEWLVDRLIDGACRIITGCRVAAVRLREVRWIYQEPEVIYNGLPDHSPRASKRPSSAFRILHVGYFDRNKNQAMLIKALAEVIRRGHPHVMVHFVGVDPDGGLMGDCLRLTAELGLERHVCFEGFVEDIEQQYADADLFVLCSMREGLPISILEAMRAGKAVVATDVGGISEQVIDGATGFLVPVDDDMVLADRIETLVHDRELLTRFGVAARLAYERMFSAEGMIARYSRLLGLEAAGAAKPCSSGSAN